MSAEHDEAINRIMAEAEADDRGLLEAMCRAARAIWDRPLEALEMYAEARAFLEEEVGDLVQQMRARHDPYSWDEIAGRLGVTRQSAWTKYRSADEGAVRLRQRPGPRGDGDFVAFRFEVGPSYISRGELTIPIEFNELLDERLPGDGPSWSASIVMDEVRDSVKIRRGHNPKRYYQLRISNVPRTRLDLQRGQLVGVRIPLLGPLVVTLS